MTPTPKPTPGFGMVMALLAGLLVAAGWMAWQRTVVIDEAGLARPADASIAWPDMRLDLNTATAAELSLLPGIGPQRAENIVNDRETNGPFGSVSDVTRVKGIGNVVHDQMARYLVTDPTAPASHQLPDHGQ
jgi:competence ComEA-like helix-hairpin-helix protein